MMTPAAVERDGRPLAGPTSGVEIMSAMSPGTGSLQRQPPRTGAVIALLLCALALGGCGTSHPSAIGNVELAEAQTFPYYRAYWVGRSFGGHPLVAADGQRDYINSVGDSVFYGDCVPGKHIVGGSCLLPLQVTTVIYALHSNSALGMQRNTVIRGVPAAVYDGGRSIELYSGRVAIDVLADTYSNALAATMRLRPINAPGSATEPLPPPVYCPGLSGPIDAKARAVMDSLPADVCQRTSAQLAYVNSVNR